MRKAIVVMIAGLTVLAAGPASATPNFPNAIQANLGLTYSPACALCHAGGTTTAQSVTTPFAVSMKARGMVASDEAALRTALDRMAADKVDSDNDRATDVDELKAGTDPNIPAGEEPMTYGCSTARGGAGSAYAGLLFAACVFGWRKRRNVKRTRSAHCTCTG